MKKTLGILTILLLICFCGMSLAEGGSTEKVTHTSKNGIETRDDGTIHEELTSVELTRLMGNGINLGNTMEACNTSRREELQSVYLYETTWGQPVTTAESLKGMKEAGFDSIRIPVAWITNATDLLHGDYRIRESYLNRVEEIINYALDADMYVILNDHWDGGWWGMFGSENPDTQALAMEVYKSMWSQIAERYIEYSDRLIFESANEELGARFDENSVFCDDSVKSYLKDDERYELTNRVNQAFVDTVRATGGNNSQRFLLIAGYGTDIDKTVDSRFKMPQDTAKNKLLISVHYYSPWSYCGASTAAGATPWGIRKDYQEMSSTLSKMRKFVGAGYGVVIGEYGALPCNDGLKENTAAYHRYFLDVLDAYDMTSCLWDCSGLYIRSRCSMVNDEIAAVYKDRNAASEAGMTPEEVRVKAEERMEAALETAPVSFREDYIEVGEDKAIAWLMWSDGGWSLSYSVGDTYTPDNRSPGLEVTDAEITGEGTYTVGIDFSKSGAGYSQNTAFTAIGISNGEKLFPGWCINVTEVKINDQPVKLKGRNYTCSDNNITTRTNLFNEWVTGDGYKSSARVMFGDLTGITPTPLNRELPEMERIKSIYVTFTYGPRK